MTDKQSSLMFPTLSALLDDPTVFEVMVDGCSRVYVERRHGPGKFDDVVPSPYQDDHQLMNDILAFAAYMGQPLDADNPILEGALPDGSRVNIVLPPISPIGPTLNIRKFSVLTLTAEELVQFGSWNEAIVTFLRACVQSRLNMVVAGGTASGKTTVLNILAAMCDSEERLINVGGEARLTHKYALLLETRQATASGKGAVTLYDLVNTALRMRPDRLILTEARGPEVLPFAEALNMGYEGSLITIHANSIRDALSRLETMASMGNPSLPLLAVREMLASGIHLIINQQRLRDGRRRVLNVTEITGMQGDTIQTQDIFTFRQTGYEDKTIKGYFAATGIIPRCLERIREANIDLPLSLFTAQP